MLMGQIKHYTIPSNTYIPFRNHVDFCIGTGRMGLALQKEYQDQLALVQKEIGFSHIRGHGLFSDDMSIYHEYVDKNGNTQVEYNFTYLDLVMDSYKSLNIKPFIELGFMPDKLASGTQTIFYWKGNTTPPKDYEMWTDLVISTLTHLMNRYGIDEVITWPIEVWNEPNLPGFWEHADMQEYFKLFKHTFWAIKKLDARFRIGGPAICGVDDENWIQSFLTFCQAEKIPVDFITRHHYTTELPEPQGHYGYAKLSDPEMGFANLQTTRDIIDKFEEYKNKDIHITEFNTSYIPNCPLHDTNLNAAYIAYQLSRLGEVNESYSYWTFGDIFEEQGVPFTPFHGGFGLVANGCIPKPTFWTFKFFKDLQGKCILKNEDCLLIEKENSNGYRGIAWNFSYNSTCTEKKLSLHFEKNSNNMYSLTTKTVDEKTCNPLQAWHAMGEPSSLSLEQLTLLKEIAQPFTEIKLIESSDQLSINLTINPNGVIYFELIPTTIKSDRGYDYSRVETYEF